MKTTPPVFQPPPGNPRFPLFDAVRGIGVLGVFVTHCMISAGATHTVYGPWVMRMGEWCLALFFIGSGFLLYRPFVSARVNGTKAPRLLAYARNRVLRIVPAYWTALTVLAIWPGLHGFWTRTSWMHYLYLQEFDFGASRGGILPAWSLTVEAFYYAMLPLIALLMVRTLRGLSRERKIRREAVLLIGLFLIGVAYRVILRQDIGDDPTSNLWALLPGSLDWIALGMLLALTSAVLHGRRQKPLPVRVVERAPLVSWGFAGVLWWVLATQIGRSGVFPGHTNVLQWHTTHVVDGVIALAIILPTVFGDNRTGIPRRIMAHPLIAWYGLISYGFYLWHHPIVLKVARAFTFGQTRMLGVTAVSLGFATLMGATSYYVVERPFLRRKAMLPASQRARREQETTAAGAPGTELAAHPVGVERPA